MNQKAEFYAPKGAKRGRVKLLTIAAHQDDAEIMSAHGVFQALGEKNTAFYAVITTDGSGSARAGRYADFTDAEMMQVRRDEQKKAADIGKYGGLWLLNYTSAEVKNPADTAVIADFVEVIEKLKPEIIYTHNLCDKHDTHIGVALKAIAAVRKANKKYCPKLMYGCECWRALDWMQDDQKTVFDTSGNDKKMAKLLAVFDSQIAGGKRYDLAAMGRQKANATYLSSHAVDTMTAANYGMDLTPLINDASIDPAGYALSFIDSFRADVAGKIAKFSKIQ
ncbi:MAG: PIG-L family deacetylase [Firmicutes bacterium]|nr:PIG-L family deacetylase [Bacillota bacterium]